MVEEPGSIFAAKIQKQTEEKEKTNDGFKKIDDEGLWCVCQYPAATVR